MKEKKQRRHRLLKTADPKSMFNNNVTPEIVLAKLGRPRSILSSSAKVSKSRSKGYLTRVCYLSSALYCTHSTPGCRSVCLGFTSGRMGTPEATMARDRRSALYAVDTKAFLDLLREDLHKLCYDAETEGLKPACRLNGTSDIPYEVLHPEILEEWSDRVTFYDYSRVPSRVKRYVEATVNDPTMWPWNYSLCLSASESNHEHVESVLEMGGTVSIVFWPDLPRKWNGWEVIDGDRDDLRHLDPRPCVVGLRAKGIARNDLSGFVVQLDRPSAGKRRNIIDAA